DGIRDFHVTGVQTCALPISEKDPSGELEDLAVERDLPLFDAESGCALDLLSAFVAGSRASFHHLTAFDQGKLLGSSFQSVSVDKIGKRRVGKECRSRW